LYQGFRRLVWNPETSRERVGDWGGPETVWALLCVAERRATRPNGEWGYSTRRQILGPERPEAVLPDKAFYLPTLSHLLIVNKPLSLSLSFSLAQLSSPEMLTFANRFSKITKVVRPHAALCGNRLEVAFKFV
jgi:hypothetical protein